MTNIYFVHGKSIYNVNNIQFCDNNSIKMLLQKRGNCGYVDLFSSVNEIYAKKLFNDSTLSLSL